MSRTVAVVTDATSAGFWFPKWHDYYGRLFGARNLHVLTYEGQRPAFDGVVLGGVWDVPLAYSDTKRTEIIAGLVNLLLLTHDIVIRCDVDEFLVPDLRRYRSLRDYVEALERPYVTAFGIDIFESTADPPLDMNRPVVHVQRRRAVVQSALHKTAITRIPIAWAPGFHGASVAPVFDGLFLLHTKFADMAGRAAWFRGMKSRLPEGSAEYAYFSFTEEQLRGHKAWLNQKRYAPEGWAEISDPMATARFLETVTRSETGIHQGEFMTGDAFFVLPPQFLGTF
jgi:hypothetical protein